MQIPDDTTPVRLRQGSRFLVQQGRPTIDRQLIAGSRHVKWRLSPGGTAEIAVVEIQSSLRLGGLGVPIPADESGGLVSVIPPGLLRLACFCSWKLSDRTLCGCRSKKACGLAGERSNRCSIESSCHL